MSWWYGFRYSQHDRDDPDGRTLNIVGMTEEPKRRFSVALWDLFFSLSFFLTHLMGTRTFMHRCGTPTGRSRLTFVDILLSSFMGDRYCKPPRFIHRLGVYLGGLTLPYLVAACCSHPVWGMTLILYLMFSLNDGWDASSADAFRDVDRITQIDILDVET
jgi:hypothetical protein